MVPSKEFLIPMNYLVKEFLNCTYSFCLLTEDFSQYTIHKEMTESVEHLGGCVNKFIQDVISFMIYGWKYTHCSHDVRVGGNIPNAINMLDAAFQIQILCALKIFSLSIPN